MQEPYWEVSCQHPASRRKLELAISSEGCSNVRIAITGATGFIGSRLCRALKERGDEVIAITRDTARAAAVLPPKTEVISWDPTSDAPSALKMPRIDAVVHLAGASIAGRWNKERKLAIYESRIVGTRKLVESLEAQAERPRTLINGSAIGYYGDRGDESLDEDSSVGQGFLAEVCLAWETEAMRAEDLGLRVVRIRTGVVLGPDGGALKAMIAPYRLGLGGRLGSGRQWMSWIHLDDEVGLIIHAIDREEVSGALNAAAPNPVTNREFARNLGDVLGRPAILPAPAFALRLALGEAATMVLEGQRVSAQKALSTGYEFRYQSLGPALVSILNPSKS